jgi:hypothetical protein
MSNHDFLDPNTWGEFNKGFEWRIYGDDLAQIWSVVDEEDYHHLSQWKWSPKWSRGQRKFYLRRNVQVGRRSFRTQTTLYLHEAVMMNAGIKRPSDAHLIIDHRDGNSMNCRRSNLRWATHSMNARNLFGSKAEDHHFERLGV